MLRVYVVKQLFEVFDCNAKFETLRTYQEIFLAKSACALSIKQVEQLLPAEIEAVFGFGEVLTALGNERIDESLVNERHVDSLPRHEINKGLEGAGRAALIRLVHILKYLFDRGLPQDNVQSLEDPLQGFDGSQLIRLILLLLEYDLIECHVLCFELFFHIFVHVVQFLTTKQIGAGETFDALFFLGCKLLLLSGGSALDQRRHSLHIFKSHTLVILAIEDAKDSL